jgi:hypothetical protein
VQRKTKGLDSTIAINGSSSIKRWQEKYIDSYVYYATGSFATKCMIPGFEIFSKEMMHPYELSVSGHIPCDFDYNR